MIKKMLAMVGMALLATSLMAAPIVRGGFGSQAVNFDFGPGAAPTLTDGFLTVTQATVNNITSNDFVPSNVIDNSSGGGIRLDFAAPISAVGMDFFTNNANVTLSIFDAGNALIESLVIPVAGLPIGSAFPFPYGFIGLDAGVNNVAYAIIDTPLNGSEIRIDNIVYQGAPEPGTLALLGLGLAGLAASRRRKQ